MASDDKFLILKKNNCDTDFFNGKLAELIEYATYEVEKIASINPQVGEDEELC